MVIIIIWLKCVNCSRKIGENCSLNIKQQMFTYMVKWWAIIRNVSCTLIYIPVISLIFMFLLAHMAQRARWAIAITWHPSLSSIVRLKLFQRSSPLKLLDQLEPNLVWIITRVSSFKIVSGDAVHQSTWPLLLKIEHMVKLQVFG